MARTKAPEFVQKFRKPVRAHFEGERLSVNLWLARTEVSDWWWVHWVENGVIGLVGHEADGKQVGRHITVDEALADWLIVV